MPSDIENIAAEFENFIPSNYHPVEIVACAQAATISLRGEAAPSKAYWRDGIQKFLRSLPSDPDEAEFLIKKRAAEVLGDPAILENYERRRTARAALAEAQAELEAADRADGERRSHLAQLGWEHDKVERELACWDRPWDDIESRAKETIRQLFAVESKTPFQASSQRCALEDLNNVPHLRLLAAEKVPVLRDRLERIHIAAAKLRPQVQSVALPPAEPPPLIRGKIEVPPPAGVFPG